MRGVDGVFGHCLKPAELSRYQTHTHSFFLQQRLQGLKALLNTMSQHLLELGTCVNDGMDLCLVTPRPSQSSTSRPQSLEEFRVNEEHGEAHADVSGLLDEPALEW